MRVFTLAAISAKLMHHKLHVTNTFKQHSKVTAASQPEAKSIFCFWEIYSLGRFALSDIFDF